MQRHYFRDILSSAVGFSAGVTKSAAMPPGSDYVTVFGPPYREVAVLGFDAGLAPRSLLPTRGTGAPGSGNATDLSIPLPTAPTGNPTGSASWASPIAWSNVSQRGFLTHFITPAQPAARVIPPSIWHFVLATYRGTISARVWFQVVAYAVDAAGAVVARFSDTDDALRSLSFVRSSANFAADVFCDGGTVPAGGRIVVEVWYRVLRARDAAPSETCVFICDGPDENIPTISGVNGLATVFTIDKAASYVDIPGLADDDVFDAMRDAAQPTLVHDTWTTSVLAARAGREQRSTFRATPDTALEATFAALDAVHAAQLDALCRRNDDLGFRLPWWPDVQQLGALPAGSSVVPINTVGTTLAAGGEVILYQGPGVWELGTVQSIDSAAQLTLMAPTAADWTGAALMPITRAVLVRDHDVDRLAVFANRAPLTFRVPTVPVTTGWR